MHFWEGTCLVCLPTAMQTAWGDQHHLQPGNSHSNCEMKPFDFLSQTRLWTSGTHLCYPPQHPKQGPRPYCTDPPATHSSKGTFTLCPSFQMRKGVRATWQHHAAPPGPGQHWQGGRWGGQKEWAQRFERSKGGTGETFVKERISKQLAGDTDQWNKGVGRCKLVPTCLLLQALDPCVSAPRLLNGGVSLLPSLLGIP